MLIWKALGELILRATEEPFFVHGANEQPFIVYVGASEQPFIVYMGRIKSPSNLKDVKTYVKLVCIDHSATMKKITFTCTLPQLL